MHPGICRHRPGHSLGKKKKFARNEKQKKSCGFSYYRNMANFEVFWLDKNISKNLFFLGSEVRQSLSLPDSNVEIFEV